jgi:predicted DNA-binding transcriptional regulator YafY
MRADRLLSVLMLLQVHRRVTARELAKRLEVSERTIFRDMEALSASGVPVFADRGAGGGWSLLDEYQTKLTGLSAEEIRSLFLARPSSLLADLGLKQPSEAALMKLQASLPEVSRQQAEFAKQRILIDPRGWRDPAESIACLPVLLDALWRGRQVRFRYRRLLCEPEERTGDPLGLVAKGSVWYLVARVGGEHRTYRVSRISQAAILDRCVDPLSDFELSAYWKRSSAEFREKLPRYYATFMANPSVMRWARYRGWRVEEEKPVEDRVWLRMRFDIEEEALQFALSFGGDIEIIQPAELKAKVLAGALAIVTLYRNQVSDIC